MFLLETPKQDSYFMSIITYSFQENEYYYLIKAISVYVSTLRRYIVVLLNNLM